MINNLIKIQYLTPNHVVIFTITINTKNKTIKSVQINKHVT